MDLNSSLAKASSSTTWARMLSVRSLSFLVSQTRSAGAQANSGLVGTTPYRSKYTGKIEQLPAAVGFITAQGSDIMLANLVNDIFEAEKSETIVETEQRVLWGDL